jgi:hypothetical protein
MWSVLLRIIPPRGPSLFMNFERWQQLSALASREQDPEKLTELAKEMNLALTQKTATLDPPLGETKQ